FFTTCGGNQGHLGLGLHIAYTQITQRLKGEIAIVSEVGVGTVVKIRLPQR
ncbi:MAG: Histidine kinase, gyrase and HSP90-like ATPase, partial [Pseudomonadota bacterium]